MISDEAPERKEPESPEEPCEEGITTGVRLTWEPGSSRVSERDPVRSRPMALETSQVNRPKAITAVDVFCGVGGLTRGLLDAGILVGAGYDIDEDCQYPYEANNGVPFVQVDVSRLKPDDVKAVLGDEPNLVAGCAPCQPYSILTNRQLGVEDSRVHLLGEFSRIVSGTLPTYVTMENLPGLRKREAFVDFAKDLKTNGYWVDWKVADCIRYGVPQHRRRLILLASRAGPVKAPPMRRGKVPTVRGAIGRLPHLAAGQTNRTDPVHRAAGLAEINLDRVRASKPGGTWRDWPAELRLRCHSVPGGRGYTESYGRMRWDAPAPSITTKFFNLGSGRFGHPEQDRALSPREAALLQTFPPTYTFVPPGKVGRLTVLGKLIGNAVPVKLGRSIGRTIVAHAGIWDRTHRTV